MKLTGTASLLSTAFIIACASAPATIAPTPTNSQGSNPSQPVPSTSITVTPRPVSAVPRSGAWAFVYAAGIYTYTITTSATVALIGDTTQKRSVPRLSQKATIAISVSGDVQAIDPAVATSAICDSSAVLTTRAEQLVPKIPSHFMAGDHWRDSTTTTGCRGIIPTESQTISNYIVIGDTTFANVGVVQIHRIDSLSATGEGSEEQHRILVTATGTGFVDLFFDITTGRLTGSHSSQTSLVSVTTSGRRTRFLQDITELVALVAP